MIVNFQISTLSSSSSSVSETDPLAELRAESHLDPRTPELEVPLVTFGHKCEPIYLTPTCRRKSDPYLVVSVTEPPFINSCPSVHAGTETYGCNNLCTMSTERNEPQFSARSNLEFSHLQPRECSYGSVHSTGTGRPNMRSSPYMDMSRINITANHNVMSRRDVPLDQRAKTLKPSRFRPSYVLLDPNPMATLPRTDRSFVQHEW